MAALAYLAAYDVHQARVFGRTEPRTGIDPFMALVAQVTFGVSVSPMSKSSKGRGASSGASYSKSKPTDVGRLSMCRASSAASICSILKFRSASVSTSGTGTRCERRKRPPSWLDPALLVGALDARPAVEGVEAVVRAEGHSPLRLHP
ncbi:hypothetical protein ACFYNM_30050 [Streptomyces spororaveus]|uniref:hypothetical protein n=1 Tax=Streptomyces spororaveus TaxID=284039 RepID=UPI00367D1AA2